jgi:hypothetical protein
LAAEERAARPQITPAPPVRRNLPRNEGVQFNPFATPEERARGERAALLAAAATRRAAPTPVAPTTVTPAVAPTGRNLSLTPKTPISNNTRRALNGLMNARKNAAARAAVPAATLTIPTIKEPSVISKTAKKLKNKASTALNATRNKLSELKPKKTPQRNRKPENKSGLERPNIRPPTPAPNNQQARNLLNFGQEPRI